MIIVLFAFYIYIVYAECSECTLRNDYFIIHYYNGCWLLQNVFSLLIFCQVFADIMNFVSDRTFFHYGCYCCNEVYTGILITWEIALLSHNAQISRKNNPMYVIVFTTSVFLVFRLKDVKINSLFEELTIKPYICFFKTFLSQKVNN